MTGSGLDPRNTWIQIRWGMD